MSKVRRIRRFFSAQTIPNSGLTLKLSPAESHHLKDILRLQVGDSCLVFDDQSEAEAEVVSYHEGGAELLVIKKGKQRKTGRIPFIRVIPSLAKKGKLDELVEKAQELGVNVFAPVETSRSNIHMKPDAAQKVLMRWQKKATEAAKQSGSLPLMEIHPVKHLKEQLQTMPRGETWLLVHPDPEAVSLGEWVKEQEQPGRLNVFIGPEGGFSDADLSEIKKNAQSAEAALIMIDLGESILKLETAFLGVVSTLRLMYP